MPNSKNTFPTKPTTPTPFPPAQYAQPNGLLTTGGELTPERVFLAHSQGIFPWYEQDEHPLWWSPPTRALFACKQMHCSRSLKKRIRTLNFTISCDHDFSAVIDACQHSHGDSWITPLMRQTYQHLHHQGRAHSYELWVNHQLVGGLYGVALNRVFCAESMYSHITDASKILLIALAHHLTTLGYDYIDCQYLTAHLASMGAFEIPRYHYLHLLHGNPDRLTRTWHQNPLYTNQQLYQIIASA